MNTFRNALNRENMYRPAGTIGPAIPASHPATENRPERFDPSSTRPSGSYPIPSFFEYRVFSRSREIL